MAAAIAAIGIALVLLAGVAVAILLTVVVIDSHKGNPFGKVVGRPPSRMQIATRRILGISARNQRESK